MQPIGCHGSFNAKQVPRGLVWHHPARTMVFSQPNHAHSTHRALACQHSFGSIPKKTFDRNLCHLYVLLGLVLCYNGCGWLSTTWSDVPRDAPVSGTYAVTIASDEKGAPMTIPLSVSLLYLTLLVIMVRDRIRTRLHSAYALYLLAVLSHSVTFYTLRAIPSDSNTVLLLYIHFSSQVTIPIVLLSFSQGILWSTHRSRYILVGIIIVLVLAGFVTLDSHWASLPTRMGQRAYPAPLVTITVIAYETVFLCLAAWDLLVRYREELDPTKAKHIGLLVVGIVMTWVALVFPLYPFSPLFLVKQALLLINAFIIFYILFYYRIPDISSAVKALVSRGVIVLLIAALPLLYDAILSNFVLPQALPKAFVALTLAVVVSFAMRFQSRFLSQTLDNVLLQKRGAEAGGLREMEHLAAGTLDLAILTKALLDRVGEIFNTTRASVLLKDVRSGRYYVATKRGPNAEIDGIYLRSDHPILSWFKDDPQPLPAAQLGTHPHFESLWGQERNELERLGELYVPLCATGELVGILALGPKATLAPYTPREKDVLVGLANRVAVTVANARLLEQAQEHVSELITLQETGMKLSSSLDLDTVFDLVAAAALKLIDATYVQLCLLNEDMEETENKSLGACGSVPPSYHEGLKRSVVTDAEPIVINTPATHPLYASQKVGGTLEAVAGFPLKRGDLTRGVLIVAFKVPHLFSDRELRLLSLLTDHGAMAIENARLYQESVEHERRLTAILEQTFSGIMLIDADRCVTHVNAGLEAIVGLPAERIIGQRIEDTFDVALWGAESLLQKAIDSGSRMPPRETTLAVAEGSRDVLQGVSPLVGAQGQVHGYVISLADITFLKEIDRLKSEIVANVSHELRAPLASIKAYTEILLDDIEGADTDLRHQFLTVIDQETDRLSDLISDVLDLSRLESGRAQIRKQKVRLEDVIEDTIALFRMQLGEKELQVATDTSRDGTFIEADRDLVSTIIKNLLSNAIKFSHPGGHIRIQAEKRAANVLLSISDEGIGIPEDAIPNLFKKFYRVQSTTDSGIQGTGLGLALAKEAAEAHEGSISVTSAVGKGTQFVVTLPRGRV